MKLEKICKDLGEKIDDAFWDFVLRGGLACTLVGAAVFGGWCLSDYSIRYEMERYGPVSSGTEVRIAETKRDMFDWEKVPVMKVNDNVYDVYFLDNGIVELYDRSSIRNGIHEIRLADYNRNGKIDFDEGESILICEESDTFGSWVDYNRLIYDQSGRTKENWELSREFRKTVLNGSSFRSWDTLPEDEMDRVLSDAEEYLKAAESLKEKFDYHEISYYDYFDL